MHDKRTPSLRTWLMMLLFLPLFISSGCGDSDPGNGGGKLGSGGAGGSAGAAGSAGDGGSAGAPGELCDPSLDGELEEEVCDGRDNDCDGRVDEDLGTTRCGLGECSVTIANCIDGEEQTCSPGPSEEEVCDGLDNDCDGSLDNGLGMIFCGEDECEFATEACVGGVPQTCDDASASTDGDACDSFECQSGQTCQNGTCSGPGTPLCLPNQVCQDVNQCVSVLNGPCSAHEDCSGGDGLRCELGTCKARRGHECATTADCGDQNVCDTVATQCVAPPVGGACAVDEACTTGMSCSLGSCRIAANGDCARNADCAFDHFCDGRTGVCLSRDVPLGGACEKRSECESGLVCDECDSLRVIVDDINGTSYVLCDPLGTCKRPTGSDCSADEECRASDECRLGKCRTALLDLGETCQVSPPGSPPLAPPKLGDSPQDALCKSGHCFAAVGAGGSPFNPPDYTCCQDSEPGAFQSCSQDSDCCNRFIECTAPNPASCTYFARGCLSIGICGALGSAGATCHGDEDCLRNGDLECVDGTCQVPVVPPVLEHGMACDPANPNGFCGPELECLSCEAENNGFRCLDRDQSHYVSCCNAGFTDDDWCGEGFNCCSFECSSPSSIRDCGDCGNDCRAIRDGNACYTSVTCRDASYCLPVTQCGAGEVCTKGWDPELEELTIFNASWEHASCESYTVPGGKGRGAACDSNDECSSGLCASPCEDQPFGVFCGDPRVCS